MINIKLDNLKATMEKVFTPLLTSLLTGKSTEVRPGIFLQLKGSMDFSINMKNDSIYIKFKVAPEIKANKFFTFYGDLTGIIINKKGITLQIDGLPDVYMEIVS